MRRSAPLRRTPLTRGSASLTRSTGLARTRKAVAVTVYENVVRRDVGCRARDVVDDVTCWGRLDPHHLLRRSQGGSDDPSNLLLLCRAHHRWVHDHPAQARALGLLRSAHDPPSETF